MMSMMAWLLLMGTPDKLPAPPQPALMWPYTVVPPKPGKEEL